MKLTRIDIHGFKSFYRKTVILFDRGITAIVGPNGCGKSNIVDAIKWVMGEQGAKNLRGNAMDDVIFAGTKQKGPLGFCEVKLTFEGTENLATSSNYPIGATLCVERRLERGKGSDYFINRKRCRLSDIQEVLAGTGVGVGQGGRRAYAIIEQGQIDQVVSARADERRFLIEEAAGVTRYRQQRRVAERKLAQTDQNLQRVADIVGEVERQLKGLKRQAKKAERFRDYRAEATRIGIRQCGVDLRKLRADIVEADDALEAIVTTANDERLKLETFLSSGAALEMKRKAASERLSEAGKTLSKFEEDAKLARERLAGYEREKGIFLEQIERARLDLESGESQLSLLESERKSVERDVDALTQTLTSEKEVLTRATDEEKRASNHYLEARSELERAFRLEAEQKHQVSLLEYRIRAAEERHRQGTERLERLGAEQDLSPRIKAESEALGKLSDEQARVEVQLNRVERVRHETHDWARAFQHGADRMTQNYRRAQGDLSQCEARWQTLVKLHKGAELLGKGTQRLVSRDDVKGPLIDHFYGEPEFRRAGISALGTAAESLVVASFDDAIRCLEAVEADEVAITLVIEEIGWTVSKRWAEDVQPFALSNGLSDRLFGSVSYVSDIRKAPSVFENSSEISLVVSHDGHALSRDGIFRSWGKSIVDEVLNQKNEMKRLEVELDVKRREIKVLEADLENLQAASMEARRLNQTTGETYAEARLELSEIKARHRQAEEALERVKSYAIRMEKEREEIVQTIALSAQEISQAKTELEHASRNLSDFSTEIQAATERRQAAEQNKDRLAMLAQTSRAKVVGLEERLSSLKSTLSRLTRQEAEVSVRRTRFNEMSKSSSTRLDEIKRRVKDDEELLSQRESQALDAASTLGSMKAAYRKLDDEQQRVQEQIETMRRRIDGLRERKNEGALRVESAQLRVTALGERVRDRFNLSLEELALQCIDVVEVTQAERERLQELEHLLEKLGDVNLSAIEEYEATKERYEFLTAQQTDLSDAVRDLTEAMQRIDETSKTLFAEAFERINELFTGLFPRLFKGGEGRLSLTHPADMLTTGIEIHCQPPGKRLQSVDLMSGGEKAMCALALIFAVFRYRPSPFCLLDEVDAPLDDVNIGRFNEVVRALSSSSQVVLVTHNKRTMEIADSLYGVTMEESGVSKLVGVQLT